MTNPIPFVPEESDRGPGSPEWEQLKREGWVLSDEDDRVLAELMKLHREGKLNETPEKERPGRPKALTESEEVIADKLRADEGLSPTRVIRGVTKARIASLTDEEYEGFKRVALTFDLEFNGEGNFTKLIALIGQGKLKVVRS